MRQDVIDRRGVHVKDFHCADCEKDFLRKDNLKAHIQTAHQNMVHLQRGALRKSVSIKSNFERHVEDEHHQTELCSRHGKL